MRIAPQLSVFCALAFAACGSDSSKPTDTTGDTSGEVTGDTVVPDAPDPDTNDTAGPDGSDDDTSGDTTEDTAEVVAPCVPDMEIFDDPRVIDCAGALTFVFYGEDTSPSQCPSYYRFSDTKYASLEALAAARGCSASCEYRASIGVDLIGCESGFRTGYEQYVPVDEEATTCLDAVYSTPIGLLRDLCAWPEKACRAECNADCTEGTVGTSNASQLSGAAGTLRVTPTTNIGQSFRAETAGVLTGIELRLTGCGTGLPATISILDENGGEVGWAELVNATLPEGCDSTSSLTAGAPGVGYFALETSCVGVEIGDTLTVMVQYPFCDPEIETCPDGVGLGYATGNPYTPGSLFTNETAVPDQDLAFKVFVK
jgi:hypothetical protein